MISVYGAEGITRRGQAYDLLGLAAKERWALSPQPPILRDEGGKPRYEGAPERHFNLSHSGSLALYALGDAPVGAEPVGSDSAGPVGFDSVGSWISPWSRSGASSETFPSS